MWTWVGGGEGHVCPHPTLALAVQPWQGWLRGLNITGRLAGMKARLRPHGLPICCLMPLALSLASRLASVHPVCPPNDPTRLGRPHQLW